MINSLFDHRITHDESFRDFFLGRENGFAEGAEYFMPSASGETASRRGDCCAWCAGLLLPA